MLNHHFATRAPNHRDPRAPGARSLRSAYPQRRSGGGRRAPTTERKVLGRAECSSHANRYRIPQRSRREHRGRFLLAPGAGPAHCACSVRRAAPRRFPGAAERPALRVLPGTRQGGGGGGDGRRPRPEPAGGTESGRGAAGARQPGFPRPGVSRLGHTGTRWEGGEVYVSGLSVCKGQGLTNTVGAQRAMFAESPPLAFALGSAGVRKKP